LLARLLILDLVFGVWMCGAMLSFFKLTAAASAPQTRLWSILYGMFLAAGVLTKGLIGVVLPGLIILLWIGWTRQSSLLKRAFHPLALVTFAVIALPWHILVSLKNPEFPYFYFVHEHFLRYTTSVHRRTQPFWFFIPVFILGFFPWSGLFPRCVRLLRTSALQAPPHLISYLCLWMAGVLLFFSFSSSKLIPYLVPIFPPAALLLALVKVQAPSGLAKGLGTYRTLTALVMGGVLLYLPVDIYFFQGTPDVWKVLPLFLAALIALGLGLLGTLWTQTKRPAFSFSVIALSSILFLMAGASIDPFVQPRPSIRPLVQELRPLLNPETPVVACFFYPQDLPVYLGRTIHVFGHESELDYGASIRPHQDRLLTYATFPKIWQQDQPAFAVLPYKGSNPLGWYTQLQQSFPQLTFGIVTIRPPYLVCTNTLPSPDKGSSDTRTPA